MNLKLGLFIVILLSFWLIKPLFHEGLFPVHDDTQVVRVNQMALSLQDRNIPVRWSKDLGYGYGYPLFNFYAPLPYYVGGLLDYIFNEGIISTKLMFGFAIILSGISMYLLSSQLIDKTAALLSAVLFMYAPYHAVAIYVRGAVGEYWAYALIPLVIWGIYKAINTNKNIWIIMTGFFISFLILSHNIISLLFLIFLLIVMLALTGYFLTKKIRLTALSPAVISVILGLLISAFFWLPAIIESKYTNVDSVTTGGSIYSDHFVYLEQLWDSPWGFGGSAPGKNDGMSFKLGKIQIILGIAGVFSLYFLAKRRKITKTKLVFVYLILFVLFWAIFMSLPESVFIWNTFSFILKYVQFPWRFIVFILFAICLLAGFSLSLIKNKRVQILSFFLLIFLTIIINQKYFTPRFFTNLSNADYKDDWYIKEVVSQISDEYLPRNFIVPDFKSNWNNLIKVGEYDKNSYSLYEEKTGKIQFFINLSDVQEIILNRTYFPGWQLYINNTVTHMYNNNGLIAFQGKTGGCEIVLILNNSPIRLLANSITVITLLGIFYFVFRKQRLNC